MSVRKAPGKAWWFSFDSIAHDKLLAGVRRRVVDGSVLGLIRQWLNAPVVEPPQGVTLYAHLAQLGLVTW